MTRRARIALSSAGIFVGFVALSLIVRIATAREERLPQTVRVLSRTEVGTDRLLVRLAPADESQTIAVEAVTRYPFGLAIVEPGGAGAPDKPDARPIAVRTARLAPGPVERRVVAFGTVEAARDARVSVEAAGVVAQLRFVLGQPVAEGAPLLELDPQDARLRVRRAEGELLRAQAGLTRATDALASLEAQLETMEATLEVRIRDRERWRALAERGQSTGDRADQADTQWRAAVWEAQRLDGARKDAEALLADARASLQLSSVEQDAARLGLERCTLRAPFPGAVTERLVPEGQWVSAGTPVLRLVSSDRVRVRLHVREEDVLGLSAGAPAEVTLPGVHLPPSLGKPGYPAPPAPDEPALATGAGPFPAVVEGVAAAADPRTRTFAVDLVAPASDVLRAGLFARAVLRPGVIHDAVLVPDAAVVAEEGRHLVFVVEGDRARRRVVTLGARQGEARFLRGGLTGPVEVVVGGTSLLFDGARVARLEPTR